MSTTIEKTPGYNAALYNELVNTAKTQGVSAAEIEKAVLEAIKENKSFEQAVGSVRADLPELAEAAQTTRDLQAWASTPSPGALFVSLMIKEAAEQRQANRSLIQSQGMQIAQKMMDQADKIEEGAMQKFACAVAGAVVSMAAGAVSMGVSARGVTGFDGQTISTELTAARATSLSTIINSGGSIISAGGDYAQGLRSAEAKRLEAEQEKIRTMMEQTKQTNEALKELVTNSMNWLRDMQANMNQTRTKILG